MRSAADLPYGMGYPLTNKPCDNGNAERTEMGAQRAQSALNENGPLVPLAGEKRAASLTKAIGFSGRELPQGEKSMSPLFRQA